MSKIELPALPPDRYSRTGDIKDINWLLLEDVLARDRQTVEVCAQIVESANNYDNPMTANDCAAAIRSLLSTGANNHG